MTAFTCKKCRRTLNVTVWPLFCACGTRYAAPEGHVSHAKAAAFAPVDNGIPCEHRGESVERVKCGCSGIEFTWKCNNPDVESRLCILRVLPKMPADIKALPCCLDCAYRV